MGNIQECFGLSRPVYPVAAGLVPATMGPLRLLSGPSGIIGPRGPRLRTRRRFLDRLFVLPTGEDS